MPGTEQTEQPDQRYARAHDLIAQGRGGIDQALGLLRGLLPAVTDARSRGRLNQQIWDCERALGAHGEFFSQSGQDAWLAAHVFKGKRGGRFVEIGGYDGITSSNCLHFELIRGWSGILVEPAPALHAQAARIRRCPCLRLAVSDTPGIAEFLDVEAGLTQMGGLVESYDPGLRTAVEADPRHKGTTIEVPTQTLERILDDHDLRQIDYVSLDVEGAERKVLAGFPFAKYGITAWTIENNSGGTEIAALMQANGYQRVEALGVDDVYLSEAMT